MAQAAAFVALYSGPTVGSSRLVALSADPALVEYVAESLLTEKQRVRTSHGALADVDRGTCAALRTIKREAAAEQAAGA